MLSDMSKVLSSITPDACNETSNDVDLINLMKCGTCCHGDVRQK
jgi:hypothetical protein